MRIKQLYSVLTEMRVKNKTLYSMLIFSVFSVLLCICCLASTTWAWYHVTINIPGNYLQIGSPEVDFYLNRSLVSSDLVLRAGEYAVTVEHANEDDSLNAKSTLYVTITIGDQFTGYVELNSDNAYTAEFGITTDQEYPLSWTVSWKKPDLTIPKLENDVELTTGSDEGEGATPEVILYAQNLGYESGSTFSGGTYTVCLNKDILTDNAELMQTLYVSFVVNDENIGYLILNQENGYHADIQIIAEADCIISWIVSWDEPAGIDLLKDNQINLNELELDSTEETTDPTEETTDSTEETTDSTEETTDPTEETTDPTEETTDPTEETTDPTEETTASTEETTAPTEETTDPTEETTASTEETTASTEETTDSTEETTGSTGETTEPSV